MVAIWYMAAGFTVGAVPLNERVSRTGFVLYILFINVASEHHLLVDPALSTSHKIEITSYVMHLAVLASMIHAFSVYNAVSSDDWSGDAAVDVSIVNWFKGKGNPAFSA